MAKTGNVIVFPSGEALGPAKPGTVAGIAEGLYRGLKRRGALPRSRSQVEVSLPALCGVADDTIHQLAVVADAGALTPETAVRLALRHAKEIGRSQSSRPRRIRGAPGLFDLDISGSGPGSFAVRIGSPEGGPWIASAAISSYPRLLRVAPDCRAICLLVGRVEVAGTRICFVTTPSWQVTLVGRSMRPGWHNLRHLLVVGGLPDDAGARSGLTAAIVHRLRSNPDLQLQTTESAFVRPGVLDDAATVRIFTLLAIAMPGLMRFDRSGGRS